MYALCYIQKIEWQSSKYKSFINLQPLSPCTKCIWNARTNHLCEASISTTKNVVSTYLSRNWNNLEINSGWNSCMYHGDRGNCVSLVLTVRLKMQHFHTSWSLNILTVPFSTCCSSLSPLLRLSNLVPIFRDCYSNNTLVHAGQCRLAPGYECNKPKIYLHFCLYYLAHLLVFLY